MQSPFPGMDPFLEHPNFWHSFHVRLAVELANQLTPLIGPQYYADTEIHTQVDELKLRSVRIRQTKSQNLVTSLEILSLYHKCTNEGLEDYRRKRRDLFHSSAHLVELDLLRGGTRPGREVNEPPLDTDYVLLVNRNLDDGERISDIWPVALNEPLPIIPVPLLEPDPDVPLDVNAAVQAVYQRARYDWRINYQLPVPPPDLRPVMTEWVLGLVAESVKRET